MKVFEGVVWVHGEEIATFVCVAKTKAACRKVLATHLERFGVVSPTTEYHMHESPTLDYAGAATQPHVVIFRMDPKPARAIPQPSVN